MISKQNLGETGRSCAVYGVAPRNDDYNPCFVNMLRCSVIVVTHNSSLPLEACLRALAAQHREIVVVDNASQDDTVARAKALAESISLTLIANSSNLGFAGGVNQGVRASDGDVLLLLNPDAIAEPEAVDALMECLARTGASGAGGALLREDGQPAKGFVLRQLPTSASLLMEALLVNQLWPGNPVNRRYRCLDADYSKEQEVEQPAGACLAILRAAWKEVGGMDPAFFPVWFEDVDLCARMRQANQRIVYCPSARFRHSGAHSVSQLEFSERQMFWYTNMLRYARKHLAGWKVVVLRIGIAIGMVLRCVASLLGRAPERIRAGQAISGYLQVASMALGLRRAA